MIELVTLVLWATAIVLLLRVIWTTRRRPVALSRPWWTAPVDKVSAAPESTTVSATLLSLRDHYAAHAPEPNISELREVFPPQGRLSMHDEGYTRWRMEARAVWAFHYADLMVRAREKGGVQ